jgi:hypothetical protein
MSYTADINSKTIIAAVLKLWRIVRDLAPFSVAPIILRSFYTFLDLVAGGYG